MGDFVTVWNVRQPERPQVRIRVFYYRGPISLGPRIRLRAGYSANDANGNPEFPWQTKIECRRDAQRHGERAVFLSHPVRKT
jgi:hypothetical protein